VQTPVISIDDLMTMISVTQAELGVLITFDPEQGMTLRMAEGPRGCDRSSFLINTDVVRQAQESVMPIVGQKLNGVGEPRLIVCVRIQCGPEYAGEHPEQIHEYTLPVWGAMYSDGPGGLAGKHGRELDLMVRLCRPDYLAPPRSWDDGPEYAAFLVQPDRPPGRDSSHAWPEFLDDSVDESESPTGPRCRDDPA